MVMPKATIVDQIAEVLTEANKGTGTKHIAFNANDLFSFPLKYPPQSFCAKCKVCAFLIGSCTTHSSFLQPAHNWRQGSCGKQRRRGGGAADCWGGRKKD